MNDDVVFHATPKHKKNNRRQAEKVGYIMKNENKTNENKTIIETLRTASVRAKLDKKDYSDFYDGIENLLDICYKVYKAREKGNTTAEIESEAMTKVTAFLHTLGKANGKYISVCEKTTDEENRATVLFDTLIYHSFRDKIYTTSAELADLECKRSEASKKKTKAHKDLLSGKGTTKAYKEAEKAYQEATKAVKEAQKTLENAEDEMTVKQTVTKFTQFVISRLRAIVKNRYAIDEEEAEKLRKLHNKETKEKRNGKKTEATEEKKTTKPKTTATKKKPEAPKLSTATLEKVKAQQEAQKPEAKPEAEEKKTA